MRIFTVHWGEHQLVSTSLLDSVFPKSSCRFFKDLLMCLLSASHPAACMNSPKGRMIPKEKQSKKTGVISCFIGNSFTINTFYFFQFFLYSTIENIDRLCAAEV